MKELKKLNTSLPSALSASGDGRGLHRDFVSGIGYNDIRTERATRSDDSVAKSLLRRNNWDKAAAMGEFVANVTDDRPLIDKLHEATFTEPTGLQWIEKKYDLRMLLRKAHCFKLDAVTSAMVADFSMAISTDLESARQLAIPPFPVTWIDIDNRARLKRMTELGVRLTTTASRDDVVPRVGWLIHPGSPTGYFATYVCEVGQGVMLAPMSYWWHSEPAYGVGEKLREMAGEDGVEFLDRMTFGMKNPGVNPSDACPAPTPMHIASLQNAARYPAQVRELMTEIGGELRHIWGLLVALSAAHLGVKVEMSPQEKPTTEPPTMKNGKPLLPLEHKLLHLHLARRTTPDKVVTQAISHHKNREHDVRSHFRTFRNEDGTVRKRVAVKSHKRGDIRLGRVEKTYRVER